MKYMSAASLALLLSACGGSSHPAAPSPAVLADSYRPSAAHIPACAKAGPARPLPKGFPQRFPFPPGAAITSSHVGMAQEIDISGFVPAATFEQAVTFFHRELPRHGFRVTHYEADPERDSEGSYRGHGFTGGWSLRVIPGCKALAFAAGAVRSRTS